METDRFKEIRALFGTMDDLCQQRRKTWTGWIGKTIQPEQFVETMRANLRATREAADALETALLTKPPES